MFTPLDYNRSTMTKELSKDTKDCDEPVYNKKVAWWRKVSLGTGEKTV